MSTEVVEKTRPAGSAGAPGGWGGTAVGEAPHIGQRQTLLIMISIMLGILLTALDQTVVGPALPRIIGELHGFEQYSWVVTVYLLTSTISVPIFGKLSDMYGRKWFFIAGILIFLLGSVLSGISGDIWQLIAYRGIQGLGGGIMAANAFAIIADLIPPAERGKWQGLFGSVFGLASVVGPSIGGFLTDNWGWRWVFYVNLPVGALALAALVFLFPADRKKEVARKSIDWAGAFTLVAGLAPLLTALTLGGTPDWAWDSPKVLIMLGAAAVFLVSFIFIEAKAKEAIIPLDVFKNSIFTVSTVVVFLTGVGLFGAVLYIPLFIQAIQGDSATNSGNSVTPMTLAIVISSIGTGQIISRTGRYRIVGIVGMAFVTLGAFLLWTMTIDTPRLSTIAYMVLMGLGLGVAFPLYTLAVQNAFPIQRVGTVTAAIQFFRSIGSTVGVAILGSVVNNKFHEQFPAQFTTEYNTFVSTKVPAAVQQQLPPAGTFLSGLSNLDPQVLTSSQGMTQMHDQLVQHGTPAAFADALINVITTAMKPALFSGIHEAFLFATLLLGGGLVATIFLKEIPLRRSNRAAAMASMAEGGAEPAAQEAGREMAASGMPAMELASGEEPVLRPQG